MKTISKQFQNNFTNFSILSILLMSIFLLECKKEDNIDNTDSTLTTRTPFSNPLPNYATISNGIVQFSNWQTYLNYSNYISTFATDAANIALALNYLEANNITPSYDPVLDVIELMNQYNSSRRLFDLQHQASVLADDDPSNNLDHFVRDAFKESALNEYNEVKIGSLYFRLLDDKKTIIVGNSDYTTFLSTRAMSNFQAFNNQFNVFLIDLEIADLGLLFNETETSSWASIKPLVSTDFTYTEQANGSVKFTNTTFFDDGAGTTPSFKWTFSNGYEYIGFEPPILSFSTNDYPLTCNLTILNNSSQNNTITKEIFLLCTINIPVCQTNKTVTINLTNEPWFSQFANCAQSDWIWDFGDGTIKTGHPVSHTYTSNDPNKIFKINGDVRCNGRCFLRAKTSINNKCNFQDIKKAQFTKDINTTKYFLDAEVWVSESILGGSAGSSTISSVKYGSSGKQRFYSLLRTSYEGDIWYNKNNCCYIFPVPYTAFERLSTNNTVSATIQNIKRLRYLPNQFWSTHRIKISENNYLESGNFYLQ